MPVEILIGVSLSSLIAGLAYIKHSLVLSGLIASVILGTILYAFGGILLWSILIAFFISSSLLTKLHEKKEKDLKNGRNYIQVISNGLVAAIFSILFYVFNVEIFFIAAVSAIAASNSDTWASEIGILSNGKTRSVTNFKEVTKGVSGGISGFGTLASIIGAIFIGLIFALLYIITTEIQIQTILFYAIVISISGVLGCFVDSYLGALVQAKYRGIDTNIITEKKSLPNEEVILNSGLAWINNDTVNFLSSLTASLFALLFFI